MSVLETFFYVFDADARKLEQGLKDADRASDKLKDGLDKTDTSATMLGGTLSKLAYAAGAALGGILSIGAIAAVTMQVADFADELNDSAEAIGVNVSELHAWDNAATTTGGQIGAFTSSLNTLNTGMNSIATKGKGLLLPFFEELGLSMEDIKEGAKDPLSAMLKLSASFQKLSKAEAAGLGAKMGLDQGTINLLSQGREGVLKLVQAQKDLGVVTTEQAEQAAKFNDELEATGRVYDDLKRQIVMVMLPAISWFIEKLRDVFSWVRDHKFAVTTFFAAAAAVLVGVYAPAAWQAAAATWALVAPYIAVGAAVAAFAAVIALVAEDLYAFQTGQDSVIGELAKKWPIVGDAIKAVGTGLSWLLAVVAAFADGFVTLFTEGPEAALEAFVKAIRFLLSEVSEVFPNVAGLFNDLSQSMTYAIEGVVKMWDWLVDKIMKGVELFKSGINIVKGLHGAGARLLGFDVPAMGKDDTAATTPAGAARAAAAAVGLSPATAAAVVAGRQQLSATNSPIVSQTSNTITNSSPATSNKTTNVSVAKVEVNTQATDGPAVASALSSELGTQLRGAIDQTDDGVAA